MKKGVFLVVEKGEPYQKGSKIELSKSNILIGRSWGDRAPDISFESRHISKEHAVIKNDRNKFFISDLMSKHGTCVNDIQLAPNSPCILKNGFRISFSKNTVVLIFDNIYEIDYGDTSEFTEDFAGKKMSAQKSVSINPVRREIMIDGKPLFLSGKDVDLLMLLYNNLGRAVSFNEIRLNVWSERQLTRDDVPDVGNEEITALVYRLRKKLGNYGELVITIPRFGYMLDL